MIINMRNRFKPITALLCVVLTAWLALDITVPRVLLAQVSAEKYLEKGREQWKNLNLDEAEKVLTYALKLGLSKQSDQIEAHRILANIYFAEQNETGVTEQFAAILKIDNQYMLPETESPQMRQLLSDARKQVIAKDGGTGKKRNWLIYAAGATAAAAGALVLFSHKSDDKSKIVIDISTRYK